MCVCVCVCVCVCMCVKPPEHFLIIDCKGEGGPDSMYDCEVRGRPRYRTVY